MEIPQIVLDTNVLVSALRSRRGASFRLLSLTGTGRFDIHVSVPLVLEYEDVLTREGAGIELTLEEIADILDYLCSVAGRHDIFFLWRPFLPDPKDDMVLELAVKAGCDYVVTHNLRDFRGTERFGVRPIAPGAFLKMIGESK